MSLTVRRVSGPAGYHLSGLRTVTMYRRSDDFALEHHDAAQGGSRVELDDWIGPVRIECLQVAFVTFDDQLFQYRLMCVIEPYHHKFAVPGRYRGIDKDQIAVLESGLHADPLNTQYIGFPAAAYRAGEYFSSRWRHVVTGHLSPCSGLHPGNEWMKAAAIRSRQDMRIFCEDDRIVAHSSVRFIHPACRFSHAAFELLGQIIADAARGALAGGHLVAHLTEVGAVGAGEACKSDCRAGLTDKVFQVLQSDCFVSTRHEMSITQYLA